MSILNDTTLKKLDCMQVTSACRGMNRKVYSGEFENCGKLAPFYIWKRYIDDKDYEEDVSLFMDQYKAAQLSFRAENSHTDFWRGQSPEPRVHSWTLTSRKISKLLLMR